jgi:hypothetical protein
MLMPGVPELGNKPAKRMAADADGSFIGRQSRIAYPEHRVTVKPFDFINK